MEMARPLVPQPRTVVLLSLLAVGVWGVWRAVRSLDAFRIVRVELAAGSTVTLPRPSLIGANLWAVDVRAVAQAIRASHPWLEEVQVIRRLPNILRIHAVERVPVAQVRTDAWRMIDRSGVVSPFSSPTPYEKLVRLIGVNIGRAKGPGDDSLPRGLRVLAALRKGPSTAVSRITEVTVSDPRATRLLLDDATEVRCGSEVELPAQLARLETILQVIAKQSMPIRAVDVRFSEPVIVPNP
jgi:cell division septal protein FtsQ